MLNVSVEFEWQDMGAVALQDGLRFPPLDPVAGVYRIDVGADAYVGEADNVARAMQRFRTPGSSQPTNMRVNAWLVEALANSGRGRVSVVLVGSVRVAGDARPLNLDRKVDRLFAAHAAVLLEDAAGRRLVNLLERGGP